MKLLCVGFYLYGSKMQFSYEELKIYGGGGVFNVVKLLPYFSLLIVESIPLFWNAIKRSKSPQEGELVILTSFKWTVQAVPRWTFKINLLLCLKKVMERKEGNQMARHPPQQLLSSIKITIEHGG